MGATSSTPNAAPNIIIIQGEDYENQGKLGSGAFGIVVLAKHRKSGMQYAIKIVDKNKFEDPEYALREVKILKSLNHKNIIKIHDFDNILDKVYLLFDYAHCGTLLSQIEHHKGLSESRSIIYFKEILEGVNYLHSKKIAHRDLKPDNILTDENETIKVADFGFAKVIKQNIFLQSIRQNAPLYHHRKYAAFTKCGTPSYTAPEVLDKKSHESYDGFKADMFSLGMILLDMVTGVLDKALSKDCENLLNKLTAYSPSNRPTCKDTMKDKWLS